MAHKVLGLLMGMSLGGILLWSELGCNGTFVCVSSTPAPAIFSISPNPVPSFEFQSGGILIVSGVNFVPNSVVIIDGVAHPTSFVNGGVLRVSLFPIDIKPGNFSFVVNNPRSSRGSVLFCQDGGDSGSITLFITG